MNSLITWWENWMCWLSIYLMKSYCEVNQVINDWWLVYNFYTFVRTSLTNFNLSFVAYRHVDLFINNPEKQKQKQKKTAFILQNLIQESDGNTNGISIYITLFYRLIISFQAGKTNGISIYITLFYRLIISFQAGTLLLFGKYLILNCV